MKIPVSGKSSTPWGEVGLAIRSFIEKGHPYRYEHTAIYIRKRF